MTNGTILFAGRRLSARHKINYRAYGPALRRRALRPGVNLRYARRHFRSRRTGSG